MFDRVAFRKSLAASSLCADVNELRRMTVDELFDTYDSTIRRLADYYAPATTRLHRTRRLSVWFDEDCRCSRRYTRLLERRYRKSKTDTDRKAWIDQVQLMHSLYQQKENLYWNSCIASNTGNPRRMWKSVSSVLKRDKHTSTTSSSLTDDRLSLFFKNMEFEQPLLMPILWCIHHPVASSSLASGNTPQKKFVVCWFDHHRRPVCWIRCQLTSCWS